MTPRLLDLRACGKRRFLIKKGINVKKGFYQIAALTLGMAAAQAHATGNGNVDVYFVPSSELEVVIPGFGSATDDGDGFGVKGELTSGVILFNGEYQSTSYDDSDVDVSNLRLGVGVQTESNPHFGAYVEFVSTDFDDATADGFGLQGRVKYNVNDSFELVGQLGYISVEDDAADTFAGPEFLLGLAYKVTPNFGLFADYRATQRQDDDDLELNSNDFRVGARISF